MAGEETLQPRRRVCCSRRKMTGQTEDSHRCDRSVRRVQRRTNERTDPTFLDMPVRRVSGSLPPVILQKQTLSPATRYRVGSV